VLIGMFVRRNRSLLAELSRLADRDSITGLPNTRVFQTAIERRLAAAAPFVLLVGDIDELRRINRESREEGDDALRRLADRLIAAKRPDDDVARVGADEFAVLMKLDRLDARSLALGTENQLRLAGEKVTFGWATYPQDGDNALALYRAADERLYARKMARGLRRDVPDQALPLPA
jgi:diguanylate cyclase (GGDEF)-like protein